MKKFSNTLMLVLVVAALIYFYREMRPLKINAAELVKDYSTDIVLANKKYLNKEIELTGSVKAFYELAEIGNVLELDDGNNQIYLYCFFLNKEDVNTARQFSQSTIVKLTGSCKGLKIYNIGEVLKFDVKRIKN